MSRVFAIAAAAVAFGAAAGCGRSPAASTVSSPPHIRLALPSSDPDAGFIEVAGLAADDLATLRTAELSEAGWTALLRVSVEEAEKDAPAMLGSYSVLADAIRFTPRFPLDPGRAYSVVFDPSRLPSAGVTDRNRARVVAVVRRPKPVVAPSTEVTKVYPSADVVPENQLRFYIHFTAPMSRRGGLEYIHLLDQSGKEVKGPFLPLDTDLWNSDRTRYTVFFDPGRVKQDLLPRRQMGPSLQAGRRYTLVVDRAWPDGQGLPLKDTFRRAFRVGPPTEQPLNPKTWRITSPKAASRDPVVVTFPGPLDHGLLLRALWIEKGRGTMVDGDVGIEGAETRWLLTPREPWMAGEYQLVALSILEDLAGNRIGRPFELDPTREADRTSETDQTTVRFRVER